MNFIKKFPEQCRNQILDIARYEFIDADQALDQIPNSFYVLLRGSIRYTEING